MKNYMELHSVLPWRKRFMFIDTEEYLADGLFVGQKVTVRFGKEYKKEGTKYICILASCSSKDWDNAKKALAYLQKKAVLYGHNDYVSYSNSLINNLEQEGENRRNKREKDSRH